MNVLRMEGMKNLEEIIAFYVILFGFYTSLFKELRRLPAKETDRM